MDRYSPGKPIGEVKRELGLSEVVKLASNENPLGPSPKAVAAVREAAGNMHLYPDASGFELKRALSARHRVPVERIVLGNGSDDLIQLIGLALLGSEQDEVIVGDPSFVRYDTAAQLAPCKLIKVPLDREYRHDLRAMSRMLTKRTKLVFIANPNNPTGTIVRRAQLESFLRDLPSAATLVLDEAYFEFAAHVEDFPSSTSLLDRQNVVGLRTFSKTYGLAGIRIGYGFVPEWLADALDRIRQPFGVNALAQVAGIAALGDDEHIKRTVEVNSRGVKRISELFSRIGATPVESYANFVLADLGRPARPLFEELLRRGVIVRPGDVLGCPNCLRVTVGSDEELDKFEAALLDSLVTA